MLVHYTDFNNGSSLEDNIRIFFTGKFERYNRRIREAIHNLGLKEEAGYDRDKSAADFVTAIRNDPLYNTMINVQDYNLLGITNGYSRTGIFLDKELKEKILYEAQEKEMVIRHTPRWNLNPPLEPKALIYDLTSKESYILML
jgi:hypothetical protein